MDSEILLTESETLPENGQDYGTVKWFSRMKGWGFIEPDGEERDIFVHYESITGEGFRNLEKGERVRFQIEDTPKGPKATNVFGLGVPEPEVPEPEVPTLKVLEPDILESEVLEPEVPELDVPESEVPEPDVSVAY